MHESGMTLDSLDKQEQLLHLGLQFQEIFVRASMWNGFESACQIANRSPVD